MSVSVYLCLCADEQNFHVFYYVFHSGDAGRLKLDAPENFEYLSNIDGVDYDNEAMFKEVLAAMYDVGFSKQVCPSSSVWGFFFCA